MQIKAGFKKDWLFLTRRMRLFGIIITVLLVALSNPAMYKLMAVITQSTAQMVQDMGQMTATDTEMLSSMSGTMDMIDANYGFFSACTDLGSTALLVIMLLLMPTAGGEQKKRSTIIPSCAGLTPMGYLLPKFILYPALVFVLTFLAAMVACPFSMLLFGTELSVLGATFAALCAALYTTFMVVVFMSLGIIMSRPGLSAIITFLANSLLPILFSAFKIEKFNPFALRTLAFGFIYGEAETTTVANVTISIAITVVIAVLLYLLTLFTLHAKKIDNSVNAPEL